MKKLLEFFKVRSSKSLGKRGFALLILLVMAFGILYMRYTWVDYLGKTSRRAQELGGNSGFFLREELKGKYGGSGAEGPAKMSSFLADIVAMDRDMTSSYIYSMTDRGISIIADSMSEVRGGHLSSRLSDMEFFYIESQGQIDPVITQIGSGLLDKEIHVLHPIKDNESGELLAILGLEYPAGKWYAEAVKHTVHAGVIVISVLSMVIAFSKVVNANTRLKRDKYKLIDLQDKLRAREELFRTVFEQSPFGITLHDNDHSPLDINPMFQKITGRSKEELVNLSWYHFTHPEDLPGDMELLEKFMGGEIDTYSYKKRYIRPDGSVVWIEKTTAPLNYGTESGHMCIARDITEQLEVEKKLCESERSKAVLLSNLPGMAFRCFHDRDWTIQYVSDGCYELTGYKAESLLNNSEKSFNDIIKLEYRDIVWFLWEQAVSSKTIFRYEYPIVTASGDVKWVYEQGQGVYDEQGDVVALEGLIIDITDRKLREDEVEYLKDHDSLTGLYNRKFFERGVRQLGDEEHQPLSVIMADVVGIKLINDAFGFAAGDLLLRNTAKILKESCRPQDIVARIGGDEYGILLPRTGPSEVAGIVSHIKSACDIYNDKILNDAYTINLSLGHATKSPHESTDKAIHMAEDYMYKSKLLEQKSSYSAIVSSINATVYEKSQETKEHAERLAVLSRKIGVKLDLPLAQLNDLELLATLHDIGKVGIDDRILKKPGRLTEKEWQDMKRHPEIGYRITKGSPDLAHISKYILHHHEHWDGNGYPRGIRGEDIPLLSRILSVVDAYDAMTEDRIYRKALSKASAIEELKRSAGTQFDPNIVEIFVDLITAESSA